MTTWDLRLGDCLDPVTGLASLADKSIDVTATDPPYSQHTHENFRSGTGHRPGGVVVEPGFGHLTDNVRAAVAGHLARVTRRWVLVFGDLETIHLWRRDLEAAGLEHVRTGIWEKIGGVPQFTGDRPANGCEAIEIAHMPGRKRWNRGGGFAFWSHPIAHGTRGEERRHPAQKPLGLMLSLLRDFSDPADIVLDPFAGVSTTLVAAVTLGRRALGWERSPEFYEIARARLAKTREQGDLLARVKQPRVVTDSLFPAPEKEGA